jgi:hypothetical protein
VGIFTVSECFTAPRWIRCIGKANCRPVLVVGSTSFIGHVVWVRYPSSRFLLISTRWYDCRDHLVIAVGLSMYTNTLLTWQSALLAASFRLLPPPPVAHWPKCPPAFSARLSSHRNSFPRSWGSRVGAGSTPRNEKRLAAHGFDWRYNTGLLLTV